MPRWRRLMIGSSAGWLRSPRTRTSEHERRAARQAADALRFALAGKAAWKHGRGPDVAAALHALLPADADEAQTTMLTDGLALADARRGLAEFTPRGPFAALLAYEMRCFAAGAEAVFAGRLTWTLGPESSEPSLLGSVAAAGSGVSWLITQRPCYGAALGLLHLLVMALFGAAICRHSAVQLARDESIGTAAALHFARGKWKECVLAPLMPIGVAALIAIALALGSLLGAIPALEVVSGAAYFLALLGGFALAMITIAFVLGVHLMWPTIAIESSDAFDAVTRGIGYAAQRAWNAGFYYVVLLIYGALSLAMVRLIALLVLKFTHKFTRMGLSAFGQVHGSQTEAISKLDAMWHMPAWSDLSVLPTAAGTPFWGEFAPAPLGTTEWIAAWFIAVWVFMVVGVVAAFVTSFYFCGVTQVYFLLRRDVDATDWNEIYYEEDAYEPLGPAGGDVPAGSLPVVDPEPRDGASNDDEE